MVISSVYNGPDGSANGGYTCGLMAHEIDSPCVEVTLRLPPPLDQEMELRQEDGFLQLHHGEKLVAQARSTKLELSIPDCPTVEQATEAREHYTGFENHPFPRCFVCGPEREQGLNIFAGPLGGRSEVLATVWRPGRHLSEPDSGRVKEEFMWCALDCPGAFAVDQQMETPRVLGRLTARVVGSLEAGENAVVIAWPLGKDGRKAFAGTALFDHQGELCGYAKAVWIAI